MHTTREQLRKQAAEEYEAIKKRKRKLYQLARRLGFPPTEAKILSGSNEQRIVELAKQEP